MRKLLLATLAAALQMHALPAPDAEQTKYQLAQVLEGNAPQVRQVVALDPGLLTNESYMAAYPGLAAFLKEHPDVTRNPSFYFGDPNTSRVNTHVFEVAASLTAAAMAMGLIIWMIRATLDYRRWNRLTRVQTEVHAKLLDRLSGHEELLEYVRSSAGAKFLEGSSVSTDARRGIGAPHARILVSVQAGIILLAGGTGIRIAEGRFPSDVMPVVNAAAMLSMALGIGFVVSALAAYSVSKRLGLIADRQV